MGQRCFRFWHRTKVGEGVDRRAARQRCLRPFIKPIDGDGTVGQTVPGSGHWNTEIKHSCCVPKMRCGTRHTEAVTGPDSPRNREATHFGGTKHLMEYMWSRLYFNDPPPGVKRPSALGGAAVHEGGELAAPRAERVPDGRHAEHDAEVVAHPVSGGAWPPSTWRMKQMMQGTTCVHPPK